MARCGLSDNSRVGPPRTDQSEHVCTLFTILGPCGAFQSKIVSRFAVRLKGRLWRRDACMRPARHHAVDVSGTAGFGPSESDSLCCASSFVIGLVSDFVRPRPWRMDAVPGDVGDRWAVRGGAMCPGYHGKTCRRRSSGQPAGDDKQTRLLRTSTFCHFVLLKSTGVPGRRGGGGITFSLCDA